MIRKGLNSALDMVFYDKNTMDKYRQKWPDLIEADILQIRRQIKRETAEYDAGDNKPMMNEK